MAATDHDGGILRTRRSKTCPNAIRPVAFDQVGLELAAVA